MLIGINGFKRSGKDTVCQIIQIIHPEAERVAFADKLKQLAAMALGFEDVPSMLTEYMDECKEYWGISAFDYEDGPVFELTGREYLQNLGNSARVLFSEEFWIEQALTPDVLRKGFVVVSDVRYANEAEFIRQRGGWIWEINRPGAESDGHASEIPLPRNLVDVTILNDGTLEDLEGFVRKALND